MKEWGMLQYPGRAPQLPMHGINDLGNSMARMGQAVAGFLENTGHFVEEQMQVTSTGNLADFAGKLKEIERTTRDEINMLPVRDWDYTWEQVSAPLLDSALNELPEEARDAGKELAMLYNRRASLEARRDYELKRIGRARSQWQGRVESAVAEGDETAAQQWLEAGRHVFIPEEEMETHLQSARSKCSLNRWQHRMQEQPLETLQALQQNDAPDLPDDEEDAARLQEMTRETGQRLTLQLAQELTERVEAGHAPTAAELQQVVNAGLLSTPIQEQAERPLATHEICDWLRRVDERDGDAHQDAALKVEIATAPIPIVERQMLLRRMQQTAEIPVQQRRAHSQQLWNAYRAGAFGCCGDEMALRRLGELQEKAVEQWGQPHASSPLSEVDDFAQHWVCFEE